VYRKYADPPTAAELTKIDWSEEKVRAAVDSLAPRSVVSNSENTINDPRRHTFARYLRVQKWTRNVDIFTKDVLVVPIHEKEEQHW
jgi:Ulp1 family protease